MAEELGARCGVLLTQTARENCVTNASLTSDQHASFYQTAQFVTGTILYPIIIAVGMTGNVLSLIVLSHRKMVNSTNVFLSALAAADIIKLLNDFLYFLVTILLRHHPTAGNRMLGSMYPFSHYVVNQAVCVSAWLTVSVAVERYIAVCHATRAKVVCTIPRARLISLVVFMLMSLVAVPSGLRYTRGLEYDPASNQTVYRIQLSTLGQNQQFMLVYTWLQNLLRSIIPLFVLIVLNALIIRALQRERVKGKKMSSRNRITLMLIVVILVFILCIFPDAIMSTVFGFGYVDESNLVKGIRELTDLLLSLNSAVNFMIYCLCSQVFRDVFCQIFCQRCSQKHSQKKLNVHRHADKDPNPQDDVDKNVALPSGSESLGNGQQVIVYTGPQTYL